jgi:hypothetical protein
MNRTRRITVVLAGLTASLLAFAPAAFATRVPDPGQLGGHPVKHAPVIPAHIHTVVVGGMPGWQITLITVGAALLAAVLALLTDRRLAARRRVTASA